MGNYKTTQGVYKNNFGGINSFASVLNIGETQAESIVNWDISSKGSIVKRGGIVSSSVNPGDDSILPREVIAFARFMDSDYTETYVAIANSATATGYSVWESTAPTASWTERYGSYALAHAGTPVLTGWIGKMYVANGVDQPLILDPGSNAVSIESASLVQAPSTCAAAGTGGAGTNAPHYCVTSVTPRGESKTSGMALVPSLGTTRTSYTAAIYATITWTPVDGCTSQRIYASGATGASPIKLIAEVGPSVTTYVDNTTGLLQIGGVDWNAPTTDTAYNTPNDWNTVGPPKGFAIVSKGTDERLFAWRGNTVWASSLRNGLNWFSQNDAFAFLVTGGEDNDVTGIATLSDYVIIFSRTNAFVYIGASADTMSLQKIIPIGCLSHNSICYARGDVFFWSEYGPTSFRRIDSGADIETTLGFNRRIQPLVYERTATGQWDKITAHSDVKNSRIVWSLASTDATVHDIAVVYQYDCDGFTTYAEWPVGYAAVSNDFSINAVKSLSKICTINSTYADDGGSINAVYKTPHYDMLSYSRSKRVPFIDVIANRTNGAYNVDVNWSFDFGNYTSTAVNLTQTTTDGSTVETTSSTTTQHRVYMDGLGKAFQLTFTSNNNLGAEIVGWRPAASLKGLR